MRILFKQLNEKRKGNDYEEGSEEEEVSVIMMNILI